MSGRRTANQWTIFNVPKKANTQGLRQSHSRGLPVVLKPYQKGRTFSKRELVMHFGPMSDFGFYNNVYKTKATFAFAPNSLFQAPRLFLRPIDMRWTKFATSVAFTQSCSVI